MQTSQGAVASTASVSPQKGGGKARGGRRSTKDKDTPTDAPTAAQPVIDNTQAPQPDAMDVDAAAAGAGPSGGVGSAAVCPTVPITIFRAGQIMEVCVNMPLLSL